MEKILNQEHSKETFYYSLSRMLERTSYYGFRAILILYMTGETLGMETTEALNIYGLLIGSLIFSEIIGGVFGDLVIGNRKAIITGGIIQAIGAFTLCIPSTTGLYLGLFLIVLGSGFFSPNIISNFGKLYLSKTKLLDSGFTIFYFAVNLGAFAGVTMIGYLGETLGYKIGFIISGFLMLLAIVPVIILKDNSQIERIKSEVPVTNRILNIVIAFIAVALFWAIYEISNIRIFDLQLKFNELSSLDIPAYLWQSINAIFILPISLIAIFLWTYFYNSQFFKLVIGFVFGAISLGILLMIPEVPAEKHTIIYLASLLFLAISEIHVAPIIHSILTKYANPKYLAILVSLAFVPGRLTSLLLGFFNDIFYDDTILTLTFGIIVLTVMAIGIAGYLWWNKTSRKDDL